MDMASGLPFSLPRYLEDGVIEQFLQNLHLSNVDWDANIKRKNLWEATERMRPVARQAHRIGKVGTL